MSAKDLRRALQRIAFAEPRPSSKHKGYYHAAEVERLQRTARVALHQDYLERRKKGNVETKTLQGRQARDRRASVD